TYFLRHYFHDLRDLHAFPTRRSFRSWLEREVAREYAQIRDAALSDPQKAFTNAEVEQAASDLTVFAKQRGDAVLRQVAASRAKRSEEHTSELQSHLNLVCRLLLEKTK